MLGSCAFLWTSGIFLDKAYNCGLSDWAQVFPSLYISLHSKWTLRIYRTRGAVTNNKYRFKEPEWQELLLEKKNYAVVIDFKKPNNCKDFIFYIE